MDQLFFQISRKRQLKIETEGCRVIKITIEDLIANKSQNVQDNALKIAIQSNLRLDKNINRLEKIIKQWYQNQIKGQSDKLLGGGNQQVQFAESNVAIEQQIRNQLLQNQNNQQMNQYMLSAHYEILNSKKNNLLTSQSINATQAEQLKSDILNFFDKHKDKFRVYPGQFRSILYKLLTAYKEVYFWTIYEESVLLTDFSKRVQEIKALFTDPSLTQPQFFDIIDQLTFIQMLEDRKSKIDFVGQRIALKDVKVIHYQMCYKFLEYEDSNEARTQSQKGLEQMIQLYLQVSKPKLIFMDNDYYAYVKYKCDEMMVLLNYKTCYLEPTITDILTGFETLSDYHLVQYLELIMHFYEDSLESVSQSIAKSGYFRLQLFEKRLIKIYLSKVKGQEKEKQEHDERIIFLIYILLLQLVSYFQKIQQTNLSMYEEIQLFLNYIDSSHLPQKFKQFKASLEIEESGIKKEDFDQYSELTKLKFEPTSVADIHKYLETVKDIENNISFVCNASNELFQFEQNLVNLGGDILEEYSDEVEEIIEEAESVAAKSEKLQKADKEIQEKKKQYKKRKYNIYERIIHYYLNSEENQKKFVIISAPMDAGKTTFIKRITLCINRLNTIHQQSLLIPIYLRLKNFDQAIISNQPLKEILIKDPFNFTYQQIEILNSQQNDKTKFLFILDGYNQSQNNRKLLLKFMNSSFYKNIHLLITTREENLNQDIFYLRKTGYSLQELQTIIPDKQTQEIESQLISYQKAIEHPKDYHLFNLAHLNKINHIIIIRELLEISKDDFLKNKIFKDLAKIRDESNLVEKFIHYSLYQSILNQNKISSQIQAHANKNKQAGINEAECLIKIWLCREYLETIAYSAFLSENKRKDEDYFTDPRETMNILPSKVKINLKQIEDVVDQSNLVSTFHERVSLFKTKPRGRTYFNHTSVFIQFLTTALAKDFAKSQLNINKMSDEELSQFKIAQAPIVRKPVTRMQTSILSNLFYKLYAIKYDPPLKIKKTEKKDEEKKEIKVEEIPIPENADVNTNSIIKKEEENEETNSQKENNAASMKELENEKVEQGGEIEENKNKENNQVEQNSEDKKNKEGGEDEEDGEEEEEEQSKLEGIRGMNQNYKKFMRKTYNKTSKNLNIGSSNIMSSIFSSNMSLDEQSFQEMLFPEALIIQQYGRNMVFSEQNENNIIAYSNHDDLSSSVKQSQEVKAEFSELISIGKELQPRELISFNDGSLFFISKANVYKYCLEENKMRYIASTNFNVQSNDRLLLRKSDQKLFCVVGDYSLFILDPLTLQYKELQKSNKYPIISFTVSTCGKFLALVFSSYHLRVYQVTEEQTLTQLLERQFSVLYQFLKFIPNTDQQSSNQLPDFLAMTYERSLDLFNLKSNTTTAAVQGEEQKIEEKQIINLGNGSSKFCWIDVYGDYISAANFDGYLRVYKRNEQKQWALRDEASLHQDYLRHTQFSSCGKFIVSTSDDYKISVYDIESQTVKYIESTFRQYILSAALLENNTKIAYAHNEKYGISVSSLSHLIKNNEIEKNENINSNNELNPQQQQTAQETLITQIEKQSFNCNCLSFSQDNNTFATGSPDGTISVWQIMKEKSQFRLELNCLLQGHSSEVTALAYSLSNNLLASCANDYSIYVWKYSSMHSYQRIDRGVLKHGDAVSSIAFSPDTTRLASGGWDEVVKIWKINYDEKSYSFELQTKIYNQQAVLCVAYSPSGDLLAYGSIDEHITICKSSDKAYEQIQKINGKYGWVYSLSFSLNGKQLFAGTQTNMYRVYEVGKNVNLTFEQITYKHQVNVLSSLKNGELIFTGSKKNIQPHKLQSDKKYKQSNFILSTDFPINGLAVSKNENYIAYGSQYLISVIRYHKNQEKIPYPRHEIDVCYLKFLPNDILVSLDYQGVMKMFDSNNHFKEIFTMKLIEQQARLQIKFAFSYNCEYFVTYTTQNAQIWDKNFRLVNPNLVTIPPSTLYFFSPSGQYLAATTRGVYKIFRASDKFQKCNTIVPDKFNLTYNQFQYLYLQQEKKIPFCYFCNDQYIEIDQLRGEFSCKNILPVTFSCDEKYMFIKQDDNNDTNFCVFETQDFQQINEIKIEVDESINPNLFPYYFEDNVYFEEAKLNWGDRINHFYSRYMELPQSHYSENNRISSSYEHITSISYNGKYQAYGHPPTSIQVWNLQKKIREDHEDKEVEIEESEENEQEEDDAKGLIDKKADGEQASKQEEIKENGELQEGGKNINEKDQQKQIEGGAQKIFQNVGDNLEMIDDYHDEEEQQHSSKSQEVLGQVDSNSKPQSQIMNDEDSEEDSQKNQKKIQGKNDSSQSESYLKGDSSSDEGEQEGNKDNKQQQKSISEQKSIAIIEQNNVKHSTASEAEKQNLLKEDNRPIIEEKPKVKKTKIIKQQVAKYQDLNDFPTYLF